MTVELSLLTSNRLETAEEAYTYLELIQSIEGITPDLWNTCEPVNIPFVTGCEQQILSTVLSTFFWRHSRPRVDGAVNVQPSSYKYRVHGGLSLRSPSQKPLADYLQFMSLGCTRFDVHYGYIHEMAINETEKAVASGAAGLLNPEKQTYSYRIVTHRLLKWLPDLCWVNVFGQPYIDMFGREKLLSAPAYDVHGMEGGCIWLQLSPSLKDVANNYEEFEAVRQAVKEHLNPNAFFQIDQPEGHRYDVPDFGIQPLAPWFK